MMKQPFIVGDFFLINTKNGAEYDGEIVAISKDFLTIKHYHTVKDGVRETDIKFADIEIMRGFNDSQTDQELLCETIDDN